MKVYVPHEPNIAAGIVAMQTGQRDAARLYCGAYWLAVATRAAFGPVLVRVPQRYPLPQGCFKVTRYKGKSPYDRDGFLKCPFWSLGRRPR